MASALENAPYTSAQIQVWLRGLLTIAWADGHFDEEEKAIIHSIVESEFAPGIEFETLSPIEPQELADTLQLGDAAAQNFLRMAVMVALSNGIYSEAENQQIIAFSQVFELDPAVLASLQSTLQTLSDADVEPPAKPESAKPETATEKSRTKPSAKSLDKIGNKLSQVEPLKPVRNWLDQLSIDVKKGKTN